MNAIRINCKDHTDWLEKRSHSVGASAVASVLGVSPFNTAAQTATKMKRELQGIFDHNETLAILRGIYYEDGIAKFFRHFTGHEIIGNSAEEFLVRRDDIPFMHASPDRYYWIDNAGPRSGKFAELNKGILECKTTRHSIDAEQLPIEWVLQLQVQMGIIGYHVGNICCDQLHKANNSIVIHEYTFNPDLFDFIGRACRQFWYGSVMGNDKPRSSYRDELVYYFPHLATPKKKSFLSRLRECKDIFSALDPTSRRLLIKSSPVSEPTELAPTKTPLPYPTEEEVVTLPDPTDDDTDDTPVRSSWLCRIWSPMK